MDYAQLQKIYGAPTSDAEHSSYLPATCIGSNETVSGDPDPKHVSTSFRGTPELIDADVYSSLYSPDKWIFKKAG